MTVVHLLDVLLSHNPLVSNNSEIRSINLNLKFCPKPPTSNQSHKSHNKRPASNQLHLSLDNCLLFRNREQLLHNTFLLLNQLLDSNSRTFLIIVQLFWVSHSQIFSQEMVKLFRHMETLCVDLHDLTKAYRLFVSMSNFNNHTTKFSKIHFFDLLL